MNTRAILVASFAALAVGAAAPGLAAGPSEGQAGGSDAASQGQATPLGPGMIQGRRHGRMMGGWAEDRTPGDWRGRADEEARGGPCGGSWGPGAYGMGLGMMGGPMMGMMGGWSGAAGGGMDRKTAMQMRGEMMRAMGDILLKYADKMPDTPAKP